MSRRYVPTHRIMSRVAAILFVFIGVFSANAATGESAAPTTFTLRIVDSPLTTASYDDRPSTAIVNSIMLHFCSNLIENPANPYVLEEQKRIFKFYKVGAHYLIDRDGTVYRFVDEWRRAYHAGRGSLPWTDRESTNSLNATSIGIEIFAIGSENDMSIFMDRQAYRDFATTYPQHIGYTEAQYAALQQLIPQIQQRHPAIKHDRYHIFGHSDYAGRRRRTDPGELFDYGRLGLKQEFPTTETMKPKPFATHYQKRTYEITRDNNASHVLNSTTPTVVLLGDSLTERHPLKSLGGLTVMNQGIGGDIVDVTTTRVACVRRRINLLDQVRPQEIYLLIGINDLNSSKTVPVLAQQYRTLVGDLRKRFPRARLHLQTLAPARQKFAYLNPLVKSFNEELRKIAAEQKLKVLDLHAVMADDAGELQKAYSLDGLHFTPEGYAAWTKALEEFQTALPAIPRVNWNFAKHYQKRLDDIRADLATSRVLLAQKPIVLLGDSISEGHPARELAGRVVINMGISGDQADFATTNVGGVRRRIGLVKQANPADIFLLIGVNDLGDSKPLALLEQQYETVVKQLRAELPGARLHLQLLTPVSGRFAFHRGNILAMNERIRRIAKAAGADVLDLYEPLVGGDGFLRAEFTGDGLHLKPAAYDVWTKLLEQHLANAAANN